MPALILLVILSLAGCNAFGASTPAPLATVVLDGGVESQSSFQGGNGDVIASGAVVPAQEAHLAFALAGRVETVNVGVGDQVEAGQVLMQVAGSDQLAAAVEAANLEVLNARQALKSLQESAGVVTAGAQLAVAEAQDALDKAQRRLNGVQYPDLNYYQDRVDDAQNALTTAQQNVHLTDIGALTAALQNARDALDRRAEHLAKVKDAIAACSSCDPEGAFLVDGINQSLADAQDDYNGALNAVQSLELQIDQAQRGDETALRDAQEQLDDAAKDLASAQIAAQGSPNAGVLALAQAQVAVAKANLVKAQDHYARVQSGPDPDQLAIAQARLSAAQAQASAARATLQDLELRAPFSGTVTGLNVHPSEWVAPGQPVLLLSDLQHMRVQTTDLSERDVAGIAVDGPVTVSIKALNEEVSGRVSDIAPLADTLGGDVVYKTTIALDTYPPGLRAGMSVEVLFGADP